MAENKEGQGDIEAAVLPRATELVNQKSGIADGFIVSTDHQGRMESFDFKEVVTPEITGDILEDWKVRQFSDDQEVNTVVVVAQDIFGLEVKYIFVIA